MMTQRWLACKEGLPQEPKAPNPNPPYIFRRAFLPSGSRYIKGALMEQSCDVTCPYCFETVTVTVDTSAGDCEMVVDCEVCCRPIRLQIECKPGEIESVSAEAE